MAKIYLSSIAWVLPPCIGVGVKEPMDQKNYDVLLLGDYFYDLIYTGLPEFPSLGRECFSTGITSTGGAMFITASALRRLGAQVGWVSNFGTDEYSRFVRELAMS